MLANAPCAPKTIEILSDFIVMSRLFIPQDSSGLNLKLKVYDGDNLKDKEPTAKTIPEYKKEAGVDEGSSGLSTRFAYKVLSETFNTDVEEVAADPINLFYVLENKIKLEHLSKNVEEKYQLLLSNYLKPEYLKFISKQINRCLIEEYYLAGQDMFNNYINYARCWLEDQDYVDPITHMSFDRPSLQKRMEDIEKPAGVINLRDFRSEAVRFCDRFAAKNQGNMPAWDAYEDLKEAIEKKLFTNIEDLLPVISFEKKGSKEEESRHQGYVKRMVEQGGYTEKQVRRVTNYFMRYKSKKD
jgi:serine protein kinase